MIKKVKPPPTKAKTQVNHLAPKKVEMMPSAIRIIPITHGFAVKNSTKAVA